MGSGELIQLLLEHGLVDELLLFVHPLILGSGARIFPDGGGGAELKLLESSETRTGVAIVHYEVN